MVPAFVFTVLLFRAGPEIFRPIGARERACDQDAPKPVGGGRGTIFVSALVSGRNGSMMMMVGRSDGQCFIAAMCDFNKKKNNKMHHPTGTPVAAIAKSARSSRR
jgi:hypothetical protein